MKTNHPKPKEVSSNLSPTKEQNGSHASMVLSSEGGIRLGVEHHTSRVSRETRIHAGGVYDDQSVFDSFPPMDAIFQGVL